VKLKDTCSPFLKVSHGGYDALLDSVLKFDVLIIQPTCHVMKSDTFFSAINVCVGLPLFEDFIFWVYAWPWYSKVYCGYSGSVCWGCSDEYFALPWVADFEGYKLVLNWIIVVCYFRVEYY
jgi:hypothetical protein